MRMWQHIFSYIIPSVDVDVVVVVSSSFFYHCFCSFTSRLCALFVILYCLSSSISYLERFYGEWKTFLAGMVYICASKRDPTQSYLSLGGNKWTPLMLTSCAHRYVPVPMPLPMSVYRRIQYFVWLQFVCYQWVEARGFCLFWIQLPPLPLPLYALLSLLYAYQSWCAQIMFK